MRKYTKARNIILQHDNNLISRTAAFKALAALGFETAAIREMLGDLDCIGGA